MGFRHKKSAGHRVSAFFVVRLKEKAVTQIPGDEKGIVSIIRGIRDSLISPVCSYD